MVVVVLYDEKIFFVDIYNGDRSILSGRHWLVYFSLTTRDFVLILCGCSRHRCAQHPLCRKAPLRGALRCGGWLWRV